MRSLPIFFLLPVFLTPAIGQTPAPAESGRASVVADQLNNLGALVYGLGHVRATIGALTFQADEAILHSNTGELELRGHVLVTLPTRPDHNLFRFGSIPAATDKPNALVTDQPVGLSADRMTVRDGLLQASGNIVLRAPDAQLRSDELSMVLGTADARLSGHIQAIGGAAHESHLPLMPAEIVK